MHNRVALKEY